MPENNDVLLRALGDKQKELHSIQKEFENLERTATWTEDRRVEAIELLAEVIEYPTISIIMRDEAREICRINGLCFSCGRLPCCCDDC